MVSAWWPLVQEPRGERVEVGSGQAGERLVRGLSGVVARGELRYASTGGPVAYCPTALDLELLAAVDAAAGRNLPIAVVLPLVGARLPVLLGAAALINVITRRGRLDAHVAVVSSVLAHRAFYDGLYLRDSRLSDLVPRASISASGALRPVGSALRRAHGAMTLVSEPSRLAALLEAGVPVDALVTNSAIAPTELGRLLDCHINGPSVYLASGPTDSGIAEVRSRGGLVWAFDAPAVYALTSTFSGDGESLVASAALLAAAASAPITVRSPAGPAPLDEALAAAWRALAAAGRACGGASVEALRWAFGVYSVAAASPVSPADYDRFAAANPYALRLTGSAGYARGIARAMHAASAAAWLDVAAAFEVLLATAAAASKMDGVVAWVAETVAAGVQATIVAKSATAAAALRAGLAEHPQVPIDADALVTVVSLHGLAAARVDAEPRRLLLAGPVPRQAAGLLALPPGSELTVLAAGPWEAARIVRQVSTVRAGLAELRALTHCSAAELMCPAAAGGPGSPEQALIVGDQAMQLPVDEGGNAFEPFGLDVIAELQAVLTRGPGHDEEGIPPGRGDGQATVSALRIDFADGLIFADPYDLIDVRDGIEVRRVAAKGLRPGAEVVLVASSARRALFDAITDSLAGLSAYAPVAERLRFWRSRVRTIPASGLSYQQVLEAMTGTSLTSWTTIYSWYRGVTQGPANLDDVARLAEALDDKELGVAAPHIVTALATMRRIHGKVGRWLSDQLAEARSDRDDVLIDPDLSIHFSDLLEAVTMHRVLAIGVDLVEVPAAHCGVLLRAASVPAYPRAASPAVAGDSMPPMTGSEPIKEVS